MTAPLFRPRRDGWTPAAQAAFLAALAAGGSIAAAAAAAGMSRHSAYRLRRRSPAVAAAWSPAGPPADAAEFDAIIEAEWARHDARHAAAGGSGPGRDAWLLGQLRAEVNRTKRRTAAARRRAVATARRDGSLSRLPPRYDPNTGDIVPDFTARDRGPHGRFVAKIVVAE